MKLATVVFLEKDGKIILAKKKQHIHIWEEKLKDSKEIYNGYSGKLDEEAGDKDIGDTAIRELNEETNITSEDISLIHFMNIEYVVFDKLIEVYYGILNKAVNLIEEVNKLEWVSINDNFFDMNKYAGEGNIGHIIEEIKISMNMH